MKVWFVLYKKGTDEQISEGPASVTVDDDDADIDDLRDAISAKWGDAIHGPGGLLAVYSSGTDAAALHPVPAIPFLDPGDPAPNNTSSKYPLVVTALVRDPASSPIRQDDGEFFLYFSSR